MHREHPNSTFLSSHSTIALRAKIMESYRPQSGTRP